MGEVLKKKNCWEYKKCGREPGGKRVKELGICPASIERRADGIHGGKNAGRCCWVVAGNFCEGEIQGTFAKKKTGCLICDFHLLVMREEEKFLPAVQIYKKINKKRPPK